MSTNDTVLLLANGAAGGEPLSAGDDLTAFSRGPSSRSAWNWPAPSRPTAKGPST